MDVDVTRFTSRDSRLSHASGLSQSLRTTHTPATDRVMAASNRKSPPRAGAPTWDAVVDAASSALRDKKLGSPPRGRSSEGVSIVQRSHPKGMHVADKPKDVREPALKKWAKTSKVELKRAT